MRAGERFRTEVISWAAAAIGARPTSPTPRAAPSAGAYEHDGPATEVAQSARRNPSLAWSFLRRLRRWRRAARSAAATPVSLAGSCPLLLGAAAGPDFDLHRTPRVFNQARRRPLTASVPARQLVRLVRRLLTHLESIGSGRQRRAGPALGGWSRCGPNASPLCGTRRPITSEKRLQHVRTTRKNDPGGARLRARPRHVRGLRRRNRRRALTYGLVHVDGRARSSMSRTGSTQPGRLEQDPDRRLPRQRVETPRTQTVGGYRRLHMGPAELHPMITAAAPTAPRALHREDLHDRLNCPTVATRQSSAYSPIVASTRSGITSLLGAAVRIPQVGFRTSPPVQAGSCRRLGVQGSAGSEGLVS
jgi:hypothetical protein